MYFQKMSKGNNNILCNFLLVYLLFTVRWCSCEPNDQIANGQVLIDKPSKPASYAVVGGGQVPVTTRSSSSVSFDNQSQNPKYVLGKGRRDDITCSDIAHNDHLGLEAICAVHRQLDDDANGDVDPEESAEFLRQELKCEGGDERRQKAFHRNDDNNISVKELWESWIRSEVHNWTVEQTTEWLATSVELPQYVPKFIMHQVNGATLPRLAVSNMQYLTNVLGIKDPIHKQKIYLKAMDVVLFGPPKADSGNLTKDLVLVTLLLGALVSCWYIYTQNKRSRKHLQRMMKDMESLHKAEQALEDLQTELKRARVEQDLVTSEKQNLEQRLLAQEGDNMELRSSHSDLEVTQLKTQLEVLRGELARAEGELQDRCWTPPAGLQQWLQLTHEIENKTYIKKKLAAEKQLQHARDACEKLRKKRSSLVGAFVSTHGKSIDDVDRSIVEARTSLSEVTQELKERAHRWKQIELLCGFNIINNNGIQFLENLLYRGVGVNGRGFSLRSRMGSSQDDLDDDTSSLYSPSSVGLDTWQHREGADSSGSEGGKQELLDDDATHSQSLDSGVHFVVGGDSPPLMFVSPTMPWQTPALAFSWVEPSRESAREPSREQSREPPRRSDFRGDPERTNVPRSYSQDADLMSSGIESVASLPKQSFSDISLGGESNTVAQITRSHAPKKLLRDASRDSYASSHTSSQSSSAAAPAQSPDEEAGSTDSNSTAADEESARKKRKHKLNFFKYSRGSKKKAE